MNYIYWRIWYSLGGVVDSCIVKGPELDRAEAITEMRTQLPSAKIGQVERA